ncbi:MAG: ferritin-like domain-containing protein [Oligoflexia bacterium]|nr:ferritin-like domain-containing protein [Oligoflexia bacterium]
MSPETLSTSKEVMKCLQEILQAEMAGIMRYLHYSFMIMGHNRIPIQKWFRDQASESMMHAVAVGEKITSFGGHPPSFSAEMKESNVHSINAMLEESLSFELEGLALYKKLVALAGDDIALEEMAREFVRSETEHVEEVQKMLRSSK